MNDLRTPKCRASALIVTSLILLASTTSIAPAKLDDWRVEWAQHVAQGIVAELSEACPISDPGDQAAFDSCRAKVFKSTFIPENMADYVMWGGGKLDIALKDRGLTQFGKKIWVGLYLPLFMFTGESTQELNEQDGRLLLRLESRFRNALKPGEYPYPFWHAEAKWGAYNDANELVFTIDVTSAKVLGIQRSPFGKDNPELRLARQQPPRKFNKDEWMWKDENGVMQPKVTLFDGLYKPENPYLRKMEAAYTAFALEMRNNNCMVCHVPNNPEKMKNLILLQTPAHTAGEIDRIIRAVKAEAMPAKSWAGPKGFNDPAAKDKFLAYAQAFKAQVDSAAEWETRNSTTQ